MAEARAQRLGGVETGGEIACEPFEIAAQSSEAGVSPDWSCPVTKVTAWFTSRCVTGMPA